MGSSGLIYAAIVAAWAAVLVPRWVRRHEEIEQARELDAARGVRVLARSTAASRGRHRVIDMPALAGEIAIDGAPKQPPDVLGRVPVREIDQRFAAAARRRRRVLAVLVALVAVVAAGVAAGRLPGLAVVAPVILLAMFLVMARRAAVAQAQRRSSARRAAAAAVVDGPPTRIAILEEPEPLPPIDPDAWEPVPVPRPTYMTKAKAEAQAVRTIDLSAPGAWTSGRLNPAESIVLPPQLRPLEAVDDEVAELPEHRRAVGD